MEEQKQVEAVIGAFFKPLFNLAIKNAKDEEKEEEKEKGKDDKKIENEDIDKRKIIDEIGGILKGKVFKFLPQPTLFLNFDRPTFLKVHFQRLFL